jgi:hypothetical protein
LRDVVSGWENNRMRQIALGVVGIALLGACSSLMTPSGSAATRWAKLEKSRADKASGANVGKICKTMTQTGSNFPQKVCSTQAEWDEFDKQARRSAEDFDAVRRSGITGTPFEQGGN